MNKEVSCKECPTKLTVEIEQEGLMYVALTAAMAGWGYMNPDFYCPEHRIIVEAFAAMIDTDLDAVTLPNAQPARKVSLLRRGIPFFECPDCGAISPNANDIAEAYCFRCHEFKGDPR